MILAANNGKDPADAGHGRKDPGRALQSQGQGGTEMPDQHAQADGQERDADDAADGRPEGQVDILAFTHSQGKGLQAGVGPELLPDCLRGQGGDIADAEDKYKTMYLLSSLL